MTFVQFRYRAFWAWCLAALLLLTAQSAAVARTMAGAEGKMTLCTGYGPVVVYIDENGDLTSAPHVCPDCAFGLFVAGPVPALDVIEPVFILRRAEWAEATFIALRRNVFSQARGPPFLEEL